VRAMIVACGSATAVLCASPDQLGGIPGVGRVTVDRLKEHLSRSDLRERVVAQQQRADRAGAEMLTVWDAAFPELLRQAPDPPVLLWTAGRRPWLDHPCVAIVGTRTPTDYGRSMAVLLARGLTESGVLVVSGLAVGIDGIVHRECMAAGGGTIAVFGSGLDRVYPGRHRQLARDIREKGALLSEFPMGAKPEAGNFPRRNRIISGLCAATVVVEARMTGGALITARIALDQNREIFALPGPVNSPQSSGCNELIRRGEAHLVTSAGEIVDALGLATRSTGAAAGSGRTRDEDRLYRLIGVAPKHVDDLCVESGIAIADLLALLLRLECKRDVRQLPGSRFVRYDSKPESP